MPNSYTYEVFLPAIDNAEDDESAFFRAERNAQQFAREDLTRRGYRYGGHGRDVGPSQRFRQRSVGKKLFFDILNRGDAIVFWRVEAVFASFQDASRTLSSLRDRGVAIFLKFEPFETLAADPLFWSRLERRIRSMRAREGWADCKRRGYEPKYLHLNCPFGFRPQEVDGKLVAVECPQAREAARVIARIREETHCGAWRCYLKLKEMGIRSYRGRPFCLNVVTRLYRTVGPKGELPEAA